MHIHVFNFFTQQFVTNFFFIFSKPFFQIPFICHETIRLKKYIRFLKFSHLLLVGLYCLIFIGNHARCERYWRNGKKTMLEESSRDTVVKSKIMAWSLRLILCQSSLMVWKDQSLQQLLEELGASAVPPFWATPWKDFYKNWIMS